MNKAPRPTVAGTCVLLIALVLAHAMFGDDLADASVVGRKVALIVGSGIAASLLCDLMLGCRNLIRTDVVCIACLYVLTLIELVDPQPDFNEMISVPAMESAINMILLGFAGLCVGRHLVRLSGSVVPTTGGDLPASYLVKLVVGATLVASFYMLLATDFNPMRVFDAIIGPRFSQPWGRARFGGWMELLNELGLFFYLVPPLTAVVTVRRREVGAGALALVWVCCLFTMFNGFASGTRNVFLIHLMAFAGAYLLFVPNLSAKRLVLAGAVSCLIAGAASYYMLEFRQIGLRNYLNKEMYASEEGRDHFSIDNNVISISEVVSAIPAYHRHLGWEVPIWALIKPIPRAIWPGKPKGLSISIEEAVGGNAGYTVATTFIGESYMAFGAVGVVAASLILGMLASAWNSLAGRASQGFGTVVYASGFFAASITVRSVFWLTTALLPSLALVLLWRFVLAPNLASEAFRRRRSGSSPTQELPASHA